MDRGSCPASSQELLTVIREFSAGQETAVGLDLDPAECAQELVALAESLAVVTSALASAMVRYDRLDAGSPAALLVQDGHLHPAGSGTCSLTVRRPRCPRTRDAVRRAATRQTGEDPATGTPGAGFAWRKTSPAQLMVIASHDLLTGKRGAEPATFADGTIIPAETARRYVCEAALNRVVLATDNEPLQLGRTARLFTTSQVKAMIVRDRTCQWKGCEVPATRCTPHHAIPWSQGGESNTDNGVMYCPVHHRMAHEDHPASHAGPHCQTRSRAA